MSRHLKWAVPTAYLVVFVLVTAVSHAMRAPTPSAPAADTGSTLRPSSAPALLHPATPSSTRPAARRVHLVRHGSVVLPDRRVTPGAISARVKPANIQRTICRAGYSASIRPSESYTTALKVKQLRAGYNDRGDLDTSDYEEDHLISLELGGSPTSAKNLWPEPYRPARGGADVKDKIEDKLHSLVCDGIMPLRAAQHAIASNWYAAYQKYILRPEHRAAVAARRARLAAQRQAAAARRRAAAARQRAAAERRAERAAQRRAQQRYTPPPTSCTTTSSGSCIQGGEFCPQADYGQSGTDANGRTYVCTGDTEHPHWE